MITIGSIDQGDALRPNSAQRIPERDFTDELQKEQAGFHAGKKDQRAAAPGDGPKDVTRAPSDGAPDRAQQQGLNAASARGAVENPGMEIGLRSGAVPTSQAAVQPSFMMVHANASEVQPIGVTEALMASRVYGIHLLAGSYLSELALADSLGAAQPPDPSLPLNDLLLAPMAAAAMTDGQSAEEPSLPGVREDVTAMGATAVSAADETEMRSDRWVSEVNAQSNGAAWVAASSAQEMSWPERTLRLTRRLDGEVVVWMRDFRLSHETASQMFGTLVATARTQGMSVNRIMLNGAEVWARGNF
jgi:hypothetical protein